MSIQDRIRKGLTRKPEPKVSASKNDKHFRRARFLVTFGGVGTIWYAPGTLGSVAGILLFVVMASLGALVAGAEGALALLIASTVVVFVLGIRCSNTYMEVTKDHDPSEIVVDEVVGMVLTILLTFSGLGFVEEYVLGEVKEVFGTHMLELIVMMFISFRIMDVLKPWPISWFDANVKGGFGVMLDDVLAAIAAAAMALSLYGLLINTAWKPF
jgi:phosphatidylglycerophosphatase A